jgi:hypothetical protein
VSASVALGADGQSLVVTPAALLDPATAYALTLTGIADPAGNVTASVQRTFFTVDDVPPVVNLLLAGAPVTDGQTLAVAVPWNFTVSATDASGIGQGAIRVTIDGTTVPVLGFGFTYQWPASAVGGTSTIQISVKDARGNETVLSRTVQLTPQAGPTVSFTAPAVASVSVQEGALLEVAVSATATHALASIELRIDGRPVQRVPQSGTTGSLSYG